ncbi:mrpl-34 [Pristionchus pacificus]|uniref:Mrpl-34 n=1 Tax=Pristionchus pacificus TaxID=54126 RepID=A0A2A6CCW0_PRIPA|nr:mrpl-34 [Pristionchus pacificus]|eukprot:PDM75956.1 mrpl-34 [Pristionchus pacificus]
MPAVPRVDRLKTLYSSAKALNDGYKVYGVPKTSVTTRSFPSPHRITLRFDPLSTSSAGINMVCGKRLKLT